MRGMIKEISIAIQKLSHPQLKKTLTTHFNKNAQDQTQLFTEKHGYDRSSPTFDRASYVMSNGLTFELLLNTVFVYSPTAVCLEVTKILLKEDRLLVTNLYAFYQHPSDPEANEWVMETVMHYAPDTVRRLIVERIKDLTDKNLIIETLFRRERNFRRLIQILNFSDEVSSSYLIVALNSLPSNLLLPLFRTSFFPPTYDAFIDLFKECPPEKIALAALNLLHKFTGSELKKLIFGGGFLSASSINLLHSVFEFQSENAVAALLKLLITQLDDFELTALLTQRGSSSKNHTPMELAFKRRDNHLVALAIAELIYQKPNLKSVLSSVSLSQFNSAMHLAAANDNSEVVKFFVTQPDAPVEHVNFINKLTMLNIAQENGCEKVQIILQAWQIYKHIQNCSNNDTAVNLEWVKALLTQHPTLVSCRLGKGKTLLSYAASKGLSTLVSLFLRAGATIEKDENGLTPIDEALKINSLPVLQIFTQSDNGKNISNLLDTLFKTNPIKPSYEHLQTALQHTDSQQTLQNLLEDYCQQRNDCFVFLLIEAARLVQINNDPGQQAIKSFLKKSLQQFNQELSYLKENALQIELIVFIFSIKPTFLISILYSLNLDESSKKSLEIVLSRGVVQAAIFSKFTLDEHQLYYKFLRNLFTENQEALRSIAAIHFTTSKLYLLPGEIVREFSMLSTQESLLVSSKKRVHLSLLVLTIEKLLENEANEDKNLKGYFKQLDKEIKHLQQNPFTLNTELEFQQMLNVACHPQLKLYLKKVCEEENGLLNDRIKLFFISYDKKFSIIINSLLHDFFMEYSSSYDLISTLNHHQGFVEFVSSRPVEQVQDIIFKLQNSLRICSNISAFLVPTYHFENEETSARFCNWLFQLKRKKECLKLGSFANHLDEIHREIKNFLNSLNQKSTKFHDVLEALLSNLDGLTTYLFNMHLAREPLMRTEKLMIDTQQFTREFNTAKKKLLAIQGKSNYANLPPQLAVFANLIAEINVNALTQQIIQVSQAIDRDSQQFMSDFIKWTATQTQHSYRQFLDFETADFFEEWFKKITANHLKIGQEIDNLNQHIISAILATPKNNTLLPLLFQPIYLNGNKTQVEFLLSILPQLMHTTLKKDWEKIDQHFENILFLHSNLVPLLIDLRILNYETFTIEALLAVFYEAPEEQLSQFISFCSPINLLDFKEIISYVLAAKQQDMPFAILKSENQLDNVGDLSYWLEAKLEAINAHVSDVMSYQVLRVGFLHNEEKIEECLSELSRIIEKYDINPHVKTINQLILSYSKLLQKKPSSPSRLLLSCFSSLIKKSSIERINKIISQMDPTLVDRLLAHSLAGLNSEDASHDLACRQLLTSLTQLQFASNKQALEQIKYHLGQQDLEILDEESLILIASDVLNNPDTHIKTSVYNGLWVQRLLSSPRFIAAINPPLLKALVDRYRFISLTLKQDEFEQLNRTLRSNFAFNEHHQESISRLEQSIASSPKHREHLYRKRLRLLEFRANDSIRALLTQLEDQCLAEKQTNTEVAEAALDVLYAHYNDSLSSLRADFLFKVADFIVGRVIRSKGDIATTQNSLLQWLTHYLPHKNFEQNELARKTFVALHNAEGKQIGFLNEANYAMAFVEDEPTSLLEIKGFYPGMSVYDNDRCLIGSLTPSGKIKRENLFQKETSALLITKVPKEHLSKSPAALELLITDVLTESTLGQVYTKSEREKQAWIKEQVSLHLAGTKKKVHKDNLMIIVEQHKTDEIFHLLENIKLEENGLLFFDSILTHEAMRKELFDPARQNAVFTFFNHIPIEKIFANYLEHHHERHWFAEGFKLFAQFARISDQPELLSVALAILHERAFKKKIITEVTYDSILAILLGSEICAKIIWSSFLKASEADLIQNVNTGLAENLTTFFYKYHVIPLIYSLNGQENWQRSAQYHLLLLILAKQRQQIFQENEWRYSEKFAWSNTELQQMSRFVSRHLRQVINPDENMRIGKKLFSELIFRCANFGQTELFYDRKGHLDVGLAGNIMERSYFHAIAAKNYLAKEIKQAIKGIVSQFKSWFDNKHQESEEIKQLLKKNQALVDWKELCQQSWSMSDSMTNLPAITAYLINYSGQKEPLTKLLQDYFSTKEFQNNPQSLHAITQVMAKFPQRNVSNCIFFTIEAFLTTHPQLLDITILNHMMVFFAYHSKPPLPASPNNLGNPLINHFGAQKRYGLLSRSCELVKPTINTPSAMNLLEKIQLEARTEGQLSHFLGSWYFVIISFALRLWHYGFGESRNLSQAVIFCDAQSSYLSPIESVEKIETPLLGGQTIVAQLETNKKLQALQQRYQLFLKQESLRQTETSKQPPSNSIKGPRSFGLFANPLPDQQMIPALNPLYGPN
jgi:hypothetical protein